MVRDSSASHEPARSAAAGAPPRPALAPSRRVAAVWDRAAARGISLDGVLFVLALGVFLATRFYRLEDFPIYFFTDEAVQSTLARDFLDNGLKDAEGRYFPTYFKNAASYNLSVSVYVQTIPYWLFGFSVVATRAASVLIAFTGMAAVGLILRDAFNIRYWWVGVLLLAITPVWFLHSRTAFETVEAVAFYAWFLYFYLRYRTDRPIFLLPALLFAGLAFYGYNGSQLSVAATCLALAVVDLPYHLRHPRVVLAGLGVCALLAIPYVRFRLDHPDEIYLHLRALDSYWLNDEHSLWEKVEIFWSEYRLGISPRYWFDPDHPRDLVRHQMKGWGNIWWPTLPFALIGLVAAVARIKQPAYRVLLVALFAAPVGGAIVAVAVTRVLLFVVPVALLASIGVATVLAPTKRVSYPAIAMPLFLVLAGVASYMTYDALERGPTWYTDYGLGGLQYGGPQIAAAVEDEMAEDSATRYVLTPTWANGTDTIFEFFLGRDPRVSVSNVDAYIGAKLPLDDRTILVMTREEFLRAENDPKFTDIRIERTLPYPDDTVGFYFVRMRYSPGADALFEAERIERQKPIAEELDVNGEVLKTVHSLFEAGRIQDLFDDDTYTLVRGAEANPLIVDVTYPSPRAFSSLALTIGTHDVDLTVRLFDAGGAEAASYSQEFLGQGADPTLNIEFSDAPSDVKRVVIEIRDARSAGPAKLHVREIALR